MYASVNSPGHMRARRVRSKRGGIGGRAMDLPTRLACLADVAHASELPMRRPSVFGVETHRAPESVASPHQQEAIFTAHAARLVLVVNAACPD